MSSSAFDLSTPRLNELKAKLIQFCEEDVVPAQIEWERSLEENLKKHGNRFHAVPTIMEKLKAKAKSLGLWNLWMPRTYLPLGAGLSNLEYAQLAEIMGRYPLSSEATNCSAPDTGNMEVLAKYGTEEQKKKWLVPLMNGEIRSAFLMTEPAVASSDATNIATSIKRDGDSYLVQGRKWWSSGAADPRCKITIVMGQSDPSNKSVHRRQSMILVPMDTPGIKVERILTVFGYDDAPEGHAEVSLNCRVPLSNIILREGAGFEIAQGRLGPGRLHHCMRTIGVCEHAQQLMIKRASNRVAFGMKLIKHETVATNIALNRMEIDQARLMVLYTAASIDKHGDTSQCRREIAAIKVIVPRMASQVVDRVIQVFGGAGVSQDTPLARMYAGVRSLQLADGPNEVHIRTLAALEISAGGNPLTSNL
jgi:acyl-CoA dehydrogenase